MLGRGYMSMARLPSWAPGSVILGTPHVASLLPRVARLGPRIDQSRYSSTEIDGTDPEPEPVLDAKAKRLALRRKYIVLGAQKSRLLPMVRRPNVEQRRDPRLDTVEEQRQLLMNFKSKTPSEESLFGDIDLMKPMNTKVSSKRYNQLMSDLERNYNKNQLLRYYNTHKSAGVPKLSANSVRKKSVASKILASVWNLVISRDIEESADVITERVVQLTKRELFTVISNNGQLPRSWTKSGAKVFILVDEQKIVLRATEETINWILVSLHKALRSSVTRSVDCSNIEQITPVLSLPLNRIQQLSNTYLEFNESESMLRATSMNYEQTSYSLRLLIDAVADKAHRAINYWYPNKENDTRLSRVIDDDALTWKERSLNWFRLRTVKRNQKSSAERGVEPSSLEQSTVQPQLPESTIDSLSQSISMADSPTDNPTTLTATFGYLLHCSDNTSLSPSVLDKSPKTFFTNIPFVFDSASRLPLYDPEADMGHSNDPPQQEHESLGSSTGASVETEEKPKTSIDAWNHLLEIALQKNTSESKTKLASDDHTYLVQIKFLPNIFTHSVEETSKYPALEMWFEIHDNEAQLSSLQFAATEKEASDVVSLPSLRADIKFTNTVSRFLDKSQPTVERFCSDIRINFSKDQPVYIPKYLNGVDIGGQSVDYIYHGLVYRRQIDLAYKNYIFQLSTLEGGLFGGRRIEANLVLDFPDGPKDLSPATARDFVNAAYDFAKSI